MDTLLCRGRTDCSAFAVFIAIVFTVIFLNYFLKFIQKRSSYSISILPLSNISTPHNAPNPPLAPLTEDNPIYQNALCSIPTSRFSQNRNNSEMDDCAICLGELEIGEIIRVLPKCRHVYHQVCIDEWLLRGLHCPICRIRVVDFQANHLKVMNPNNSNRLGNHIPGASLVLI